MTKNNLKIVKSGKNQETDNKEKNKALEASISQINENYECDQFLNISDHLLEYNYMSYSKLMHDRIKKKEVSIIFKKFYNKNIENPNYDIFYIEDEKIKLLRIYYNDTPNIIKIRQTLPDRILNLLDKNVYNTMYHGKYI